jgi:hypothetical protein
LYHKEEYPATLEARVAVMLRASAKEDVEAPAKEKKGAITIPHLVYLAKTLAKGLKREKAILDLVLVLFWGMARLGELTYWERTGHPNTKREVTIQDVLFLQKADGTKRETILLREAKTAKPGEVQKLWLKTQGNLLCPIEALKRRKIEVGNPEATLFGYQSETGQQTNLTRSEVVKELTRVWKLGGYSNLTGHSFRVGGASFSTAMGVPVEEIKKLG